MPTEPSSPLLFLSPVIFPSISAVRTLLKEDVGIVVQQARSVREAVASIQKSGRGVLVLSIAHADQIKILTDLVKPLGVPLNSGLVKIFVVSGMSSPGLLKYLKKHGCEDLIHPKVNPKGIKIKLLRCLSLVEKGRESARTKSSERLSGKPQPKISTEVNRKYAVLALDPLSIRDDCWYFRDKAFRYVNDQWIIRVLGPSPSTGRWVRVRTEAEAWCWIPKDPMADIFVSEGAWTFFGRQPENKEGFWVFIGARARLTYSQNTQDVCHRFIVDVNGNLSVARNSSHARQMLPSIAASYDPETRFSREERSSSWGTGNGAPDHSQPGDDLEDEIAVESEVAAFSGGKFGKKEIDDPTRLQLYENVLPKLGAKPTLFNPVVRHEDRIQLMREASELKSSALFWTRSRAFLAEAVVNGFSTTEGEMRVALPRSMSDVALRETLIATGSEEVYFKCNLGRTVILFSMPIKELRIGARGIGVECPELMYEVQRRHDFRYGFEAGEKAFAKLQADGASLETWRLLSVSSGGASVSRQFSASESHWKPQTGDTMLEIAFNVYGHEIRCRARVVWSRESSPTSGTVEWTLGLRFSGLHSKHREGIMLFVMEESYELLRKMSR